MYWNRINFVHFLARVLLQTMNQNPTQGKLVMQFHKDNLVACEK